MNIVNDEELAWNMENVWQFSGESPAMMTLNWRMNEMTAAVGLAQLEKVDHIIEGTYNRTLATLEAAIEGCAWLKPRRVVKGATRAGYWFACTWQGDAHKLSYDRFQQLDKELEIGLRFGFNQTAPYQFDFFRKGDIYGNGVPYHAPPFTQLSRYRYHDGLCRVVEDVMPRLVTANLIFLSIDEASSMADKLLEAISIMNRG